MTGAVAYGLEKDLDPAEFIDVLERSGLAARRPVGEGERIRAMVENADVVVCARDRAGRLIGVSRALTDFAYCCYLSDLAVDADYQGRGIGRELIRRTHAAAGQGSNLVLLAAPAGMGFYPKAGMDKMDNCFGLPRAATGTRDRP
jgi:GNAT superfamily N-acetyltransferase